MKLVNNISIRVFIPPEENHEEIKEAFFSLIGYSEDELKEEKINFFRSTAKGFQERGIKIYSVTFRKDRHCNQFLSWLKENLSGEEKKLLVKQVNRLDDELNFFIRLDKEALIDGDYELTDSGDCFHIKISIAAFPRRKDIALAVIEKIFS